MPFAWVRAFLADVDRLAFVLVDERRAVAFLAVALFGPAFRAPAFFVARFLIGGNYGSFLHARLDGFMRRHTPGTGRDESRTPTEHVITTDGDATVERGVPCRRRPLTPKRTTAQSGSPCRRSGKRTSSAWDGKEKGDA